MKTPRTTTLVIVTIALIALSLTGGLVDVPATPVQAQAASAPPTNSPHPPFSLEASNPPPPAKVLSPKPDSPAPAPPAAPVEPSPPADSTAEPAALRSLRSGDTGPAVKELESRLKQLGYDPGKLDGVFDQYTRFAVISLQKVSSLTVDGLAGPAVQAAIANPTSAPVLVADGSPSRVEVDLRQQLMVVYRDGTPVLITHVSTGSNETFCSSGRCREAVTPVGSFRFFRRISGWRTAELGRLYNPVYFTDDGVAVHGASSVPLHPASHGCVRIPMHTADLFPQLVETGTEIHVIA